MVFDLCVLCISNNRGTECRISPVPAISKKITQNSDPQSVSSFILVKIGNRNVIFKKFDRWPLTF